MENTPGKLKIYLGYAPGGGKSYAMLDAGQRRKAEGVDVVLGCLSGWKREDILPLAPGLLPPQGEQVPEQLALDHLLARRPALILVDDLAAANPPEARHPRRVQDVEELLDAGLDIAATLNIQELESLRDQVAALDPRLVGRTIPDRMFQRAMLVEMIDTPPEEVVQRLGDRIQAGAADSHTLEPYLSVEKLARLREITLRHVAGSIDLPTPARNGAEEVPGGILVCVSSHPLAEKLIRAGKRAADEQRAPWQVLYVETPDRVRPLQPFRDRVERSLALAEELGAKVLRVSGLDVPTAVAQAVREHRSQRVIVGAPRPAGFRFLRRPVFDRLVSLLPGVEITVVPDRSLSGVRPAQLDARPARPLDYLGALGIVALATAVSYPIHLRIEPVNLVMVYLMAMIACAFFLGRGPAVAASLLSVLAFDYFLVVPRFSLTIADTQYLLTFLGFLVISLVVSGLVSRLREQVEAGRQREALVSALYSLSQELTGPYDRVAVIAIIHRQIRRTFVRRCGLWLVEDGRLAQFGEDGHAAAGDPPLAALWTVENRRPSGKGSATYPGEASSFYPMTAGSQPVGVIEVREEEASVLMSRERRSLMEAYAGIAALALERTRLLEDQKVASLLLEKERLQNTLLNSISHDLRTPLATISGVISSLIDSEQAGSGTLPLSPATRLELLEEGWEEAQRLNRRVGNLLDITRLEAGALHLNLQPGDLEGVVGAVLASLRYRLADFAVKVSIAEDLPKLLFDPGLIEQVLVNLLENAVNFSGREKRIDISIANRGGEVLISVCDQGRGIPEADLERAFDKFYRGKGAAGVPGSGLGLSICRGIVQAHGGRIWAERNTPHGTAVHIGLPVRKE